MDRRNDNLPDDRDKPFAHPSSADRERANLVEALFFAPFDVARRDAKQATSYWCLYIALGLGMIALGVFALASQVAALSTLVALVAVLLLLAGTVELLVGVLRRPASWPAILAGSASFALGVVALAWPQVTLYVLALIVGIGLLAWGTYDIYRSLMDDVVRPRAAGLVAGLVLVVSGVLVLAEPSISAVVLGIVVAVLFIVQGLFSFVAGLRLLDLHRALSSLDKPGKSQAPKSEGTGQGRAL